jgi:hypothetical protein
MRGVHKSPLGCGPVRCRWHRRFRPGVHESTDLHPPENPIYLRSRNGRAQAAGRPFEIGRNVANHHARHPASGRVEHLLWAIGAGKDRDFRASTRGPLPIMTSPRARNRGRGCARSRFPRKSRLGPPKIYTGPKKKFSKEPNIRAGELRIELESSGSRRLWRARCSSGGGPARPRSR